MKFLSLLLVLCCASLARGGEAWLELARAKPNTFTSPGYWTDFIEEYRIFQSFIPLLPPELDARLSADVKSRCFTLELPHSTDAQAREVAAKLLERRQRKIFDDIIAKAQKRRAEMEELASLMGGASGEERKSLVAFLVSEDGGPPVMDGGEGLKVWLSKAKPPAIESSWRLPPPAPR